MEKNIPVGWSKICFKDACDKISLNGIKLKEKEYETNGKFPVIDQGQKQIGGYFSNDKLVVCGEPPFIIFGDHTKVKKYINFKFIAGGDGLKVLKAKSFFEPKLFYYFIHSITLPDKGYARHFQYLEKSEINVPPFPEQQRIVAKIEELFSEIDSGIESLKAAQQQLKFYRQAVLKWAFEGKLTEEWRKKQEHVSQVKDMVQLIINQRELKAKEKGKKLKAVEPLSDAELNSLSNLPESWLWIKINEITTGVEYGTSEKSKKSGKTPVLRMGNIQNGKFVWDDLVYTDNDEDIEKYLLRMNDVLFNRTNSPELVGKTAIYKGEMPAIFAGYLIRVNQIDTLLNADYLNYYLNSYTAKMHGNRVKTDGVNQSNINGEKLINYPFPYCSIEEQSEIIKEIEMRFSVFDKIEESIIIDLAKAEELRQSILKKAFEGKLVPQDQNDEPAEKLLERIRAEKETQKQEIKTTKRKTKK